MRDDAEGAEMVMATIRPALLPLEEPDRPSYRLYCWRWNPRSPPPE